MADLEVSEQVTYLLYWCSVVEWNEKINLEKVECTDTTLSS